MFNAIYSTFRKNINIYSHNLLDTASMVLRTFVFLFMFILFSNAFASKDQLNFLIISGIITNFTTNLIISSNFEIANEVRSNTYTNIQLSPISLFEYFFSQALFQGVLISMQTIIFFAIFIDYTFTLNQFIILVIAFVLLLFTSIGCSISLSVVTVKLGTFRYSSMIVNLIMIFSGVLYPISILPNGMKQLCMISPFTYAIDLIRSIVVGESTLININIELLIIFISCIVSLIFSYIIINWYAKRERLKEQV
ncbi:MAG: ABC transporter permease [Paraclostridium sp.]